MRGEAEVERLEVGDLTARDVPVIVLDHPVLQALGKALDRPLDGIIGYTFFARYKTTIDYQARTMTFEPVDFQVRNLIGSFPSAWPAQGGPPGVLAPSGLWGLSLGEPAGGLDVPGVPIRAVLAGSPGRRRRAQAGRRPDHARRPLDHLDRRRLRRRRRRCPRPRRHRRHPPRRPGADPDRPTQARHLNCEDRADGQG